MRAKLQTRVQRYGWDKAAAYYDMGWQNSLKPAQDSLIALADVKEGEAILDVACGTGLVTFPLASQTGPSGRIVATDLSDVMVNMLADEAKTRGVSNIETLRADAENLEDFADNTFDLVTCALGLMYCPDPTKAMAEALRVLKPGGRAVFAVWGARKNCGWADIFPIVDARVNSDVCPMFFRLGTGETLAIEMSGCGFEVSETVRSPTKLPYPNHTQALDAAFLGGPVAMAYSRFDEETKDLVHVEYLNSIADFKIADGYKIPGEFVVCTAFKA